MYDRRLRLQNRVEGFVSHVFFVVVGDKCFVDAGCR